MSKAISNGSVIIEIVGDSKKFENSLKAMNAITAVAFSAATSAAISFGKAVLDVGREFETTQKKASTLFGETEVDINNLTDKVLELSSKTGIAANELNEALYSALSAGVEVTEDMGTSMEFLETASKLAIAGFTTTENSVGSLAKMLNAYSMETSEADRVAKVLIQTQNKGITTVDELSAVMSQVTPTAAAMNVSIEQLGAGLAVLTAQGTKTAQATTELNSLFAELGKSGTKGQKAMAEALKGTENAGKSFSQLMADGVQLNAVLDAMSEYARKNNLSLIDMFSSIEAGKAALSISSASETFNKDLEAMSTSADVVTDAYEKMTDTLENKEKQLAESIRNIGISLYEEIAEPVKDGMTEVIDVIKGLGTELKRAGTKELIHDIGKETGSLMVAMAKFSKQAFPPVLSALKWMLQNGKAVAAGVITVNVAFKALAVTTKVTSAMSAANSTGFKEMATAMVNLAAKTKAGAVAMQLFNASNPAGWIILATTAIVAMGVAFYDAYRKNDTYRKSLEETNAMLKDQKERMDSLHDSAIETYAAQSHEIEKASGKAQEYADRIQAMADADGTYRSNKEQVILLVDKLNEALGESIYYYDEETGRINNQSGAIDNLKDSISSYIELRKAQAVLDASTEEYAQSLKDQAANKKALVDAQTDLTSATERYGDAAYKAYQDAKSLNDTVESGKAILALQESLNLSDQAMSDWISDMHSAEERFNELKGVLENDTSFISWYENLETAMEKAKETGDFSEIKTAIQDMNNEVKQFDASGTIAQVGELKDQYTSLKEEYESIKQLHDENNGEALGITDQDVEDAKTRMEEALAQYNIAREAMAQSNKDNYATMEQDDREYANIFEQTAAETFNNTANNAIAELGRGGREGANAIREAIKGPFYADIHVRVNGLQQLTSTLNRYGGASYLTDGFGGGSEYSGNAISATMSGITRSLQSALGRGLLLNLAGTAGNSSYSTVVSNQLNFFQPIEKPSQVSAALEETSKMLTKGR